MNTSAPTSSQALSRGQRLAVFAVCALALGIRAWGLEWGLPRVDLNPDELNVLQLTQRISWDSLDPGFYNYSGLTFHLNFFATEAARALGASVDDAGQLFVHRILGLIFSTLTVCLVYPLARGFRFAHHPALLATFLLAITPLHVWDSHFAVADVGLAFWTTLALLLAVRAYERPTLARFLIGGVVVGVAIGTKFNGALAGASFIAAAALVWWEGRASAGVAMRNLFAAGAISLVAFGATSPYSVINFAETRAAFEYEWSEVRHGHYGFDMSAEGWQYRRGLYQLGAMFPFAFGIALWPVVLFGGIRFIARGTAMQRSMALAFLGLYMGATASWSLVPMRYYLPILPVMAIFAAFGLDAIRQSRRLPRIAAIGVPLLVVGYTALFTGATAVRFANDTRVQAAEWGDQRLPRGATVYMLYPAFENSYMPVFSRDDISMVRMPLEDAHALRALARQAPERIWIVVSSLTYQRDYRQGAYATLPYAHRRWHGAADPIAEWEFVRNNPDIFRLEQRFSAWFPNKRLYMALDPMFEGYFVSPTIEFYRLDETRDDALRRELRRRERLAREQQGASPPQEPRP